MHRSCLHMRSTVRTLIRQLQTRKTVHDQEHRRRPLASRRQACDPLRDRRPRPARLSRLRQSAGLSRLDRALSDRRRLSRAPRPLHLRPARHAHVGGARRRARRDRRAAMRRRRAAAVGTGGGFARAAVGRAGRRPRAGHRQCLWADAEILRHRAQPQRRHDDLFRSADRQRHRRADAAQHPRGLSVESPGSLIVRGAGRARDRRRRRTRAAPSC